MNFPISLEELQLYANLIENNLQGINLLENLKILNLSENKIKNEIQNI